MQNAKLSDGVEDKSAPYMKKAENVGGCRFTNIAAVGVLAKFTNYLELEQTQKNRSVRTPTIRPET